MVGEAADDAVARCLNQSDTALAAPGAHAPIARERMSETGLFFGTERVEGQPCLEVGEGVRQLAGEHHNVAFEPAQFISQGAERRQPEVLLHRRCIRSFDDA